MCSSVSIVSTQSRLEEYDDVHSGDDDAGNGGQLDDVHRLGTGDTAEYYGNGGYRAPASAPGTGTAADYGELVVVDADLVGVRKHGLDECEAGSVAGAGEHRDYHRDVGGAELGDGGVALHGLDDSVGDADGSHALYEHGSGGHQGDDAEESIALASEEGGGYGLVILHEYDEGKSESAEHAGRYVEYLSIEQRGVVYILPILTIPLINHRIFQRIPIIVLNKEPSCITQSNILFIIDIVCFYCGNFFPVAVNPMKYDYSPTTTISY